MSRTGLWQAFQLEGATGQVNRCRLTVVDICTLVERPGFVVVALAPTTSPLQNKGMVMDVLIVG